MAKMPGDFYRKNLAFDSNNPNEKEIYDFLTENCGRKATSLIILSLTDFIERYDLKGKDKNYMQIFISHFDMFKDKGNSYRIPIASSSTNYESPTTEYDEISDSTNEEAAGLRNIASIFMNTAS